jgi:hypothetical protein
LPHDSELFDVPHKQKGTLTFMAKTASEASLTNPFHEPDVKRFEIPGEIARQPGIYEDALRAGWELQQRPQAAPVAAIERQHQKDRMTVWERIEC